MDEGRVEYVDPASGHPYIYHAESGESRWVVANPPAAPAAGVNGQPVNGVPHEEAEARAASRGAVGRRQFLVLSFCVVFL